MGIDELGILEQAAILGLCGLPVLVGFGAFAGIVALGNWILNRKKGAR